MAPTTVSDGVAAGSEQAPFTVPDHWDLEASPGTLQDAAQGWRGLATAARAQANKVDGPAQRLGDGGWQGEAAETYENHRRTLTGEMRNVADLADRVATVLDSVATNLTNTQTRLLDVLGQQKCPHASFGGQVTFMPRNAADVTAAYEAEAIAEVIRYKLDDQLSDDAVALAQARSEFQLVADMWPSTDDTPSFRLPPAATSPAAIYDPKTGQFIVSAGSAGTKILKIGVTVDPKTGARIVTLSDGQVYQVPAGAKLTILGSAGDDDLFAQGDKAGLTFFGGAGDDDIYAGAGNDQLLGGAGYDLIQAGGGNDRVSGGTGNDHIDGGDGNDVISGGDGEDVLYGGSGDDRLTGGTGGDYLEGGGGDDFLDGGAGNDTLSGGRGNDHILGGDGNDVIYTGHGVDTASGGNGSDTVYVKTPHEGGQNTDVVLDGERVRSVDMTGDPGHTIKVEGSPEFREQVGEDLDMLRSSPHGRAMLTEIDHMNDSNRNLFGGDSTTISPDSEDENISHDKWFLGWTWTSDDIHYSSLEFSPDIASPTSALYHEMGHVYDADHGTFASGVYDNPRDPDVANGEPVPNREREVVGLPINVNGRYELDPDHPYEFTENAMRTEEGLPLRRWYGGPQT